MNASIVARVARMLMTAAEVYLIFTAGELMGQVARPNVLSANIRF